MIKITKWANITKISNVNLLWLAGNTQGILRHLFNERVSLLKSITMHFRLCHISDGSGGFLICFHMTKSHWHQQAGGFLGWSAFCCIEEKPLSQCDEAWMLGLWCARNIHSPHKTTHTRRQTNQSPALWLSTRSGECAAVPQTFRWQQSTGRLLAPKGQRGEKKTSVCAGV